MLCHQIAINFISMIIIRYHHPRFIGLIVIIIIIIIIFVVIIIIIIIIMSEYLQARVSGSAVLKRVRNQLLA